MLISVIALLLGFLGGWLAKGGALSASRAFIHADLPQVQPIQVSLNSILADTPISTPVVGADMCHLFGKDGTFHSSLTLKFKRDKILRPHGKAPTVTYNWVSAENGVHRYEEV